MTPRLLFTALVLVAGCDSTTYREDAPSDLVTIDDGQLHGELIEGARRFLGIPYAKPPIGDLRWRAPEKNEPWEGVREATSFGASCPQGASLQSRASTDEDCLFLNVWTPDPLPAEPAPVMVWLHGGSNISGSTSDNMPLGDDLFYDGRHFAADEGVVIVTLNYRLGALGFFAYDALTEEGSPGGNQGLLDQRLALEWVRDNIAAFGGDPSRVTLFGESAGAFDTCFHVVSPGSQGLFHRAIGQSGACTTPVAAGREVEASATAFVTEMGCDDAEDVLACMREVPVADLIAPPPIDGAPEAPLPGGDNYQGGTPRYSFRVVVDGEIVPDQPRFLFEDGQAADVPYILGTNTDEGTLFHLGSVPVMNEEELRAALGRSRAATIVDRLLEVYPLAEFESPNAALARMTGDATLTCGTHDTARRASDAGLPVRMYEFDLSLPGAEVLGATHGAEISYVFGSDADSAANATGRAMRAYWARFAATGDPNGDEAVPWPAFTTEDDVRLQFGEEISPLEDFRSAECAVWRDLYDEILAGL